MARKYARGEEAWGECGRCAGKFLLRALVFDGYYPNMRVCTDCFEMKHPQENLRRIDDPVALWRPAPENLNPATLFLLHGNIISGNQIDLDWQESFQDVSQVDVYYIWRSVDGAVFEQLAVFNVERDMFGGRTNELVYTDDTVSLDDHDYQYYVVAHPVQGTDRTSNTLDIQSLATTPVLSLVFVDGSVPIARLAWTPSITHLGILDHYELYRSDTGADTYSLVGTTDAEITTFDDLTIQGGPGYDYYVIAVVLQGHDSDPSNIVTTGFIFTGRFITDLRFNTADVTLDSANPGLTYTVGQDGPSTDNGRAFFQGRWFFPDAITVLYSGFSAQLNPSAGDFTIKLKVQTRWNEPLGAFPTPTLLSLVGQNGETLVIDQQSVAGPLRIRWTSPQPLPHTEVASTNILVDTVYDVVLTRAGSILTLWVDGVAEITVDVSTAGGLKEPTAAHMLCLGQTGINTAGAGSFRGWLDDVSFMAGQAINP